MIWADDTKHTVCARSPVITSSTVASFPSCRSIIIVRAGSLLLLPARAWFYLLVCGYLTAATRIPTVSLPPSKWQADTIGPGAAQHPHPNTRSHLELAEDVLEQ